MTQYLRFSSIVNYRVPIIDGKPGTPEIESKWTTEIGAKRKPKSKKKVIKPLIAEAVEEEYM